MALHLVLSRVTEGTGPTQIVEKHEYCKCFHAYRGLAWLFLNHVAVGGEGLVIRAEHYIAESSSLWKHDKAVFTWRIPGLTALPGQPVWTLLMYGCSGLPSCKYCRIITGFSVFMVRQRLRLQ